MEWVNYESGNLLILMMIIEKLEKTFLRRREEVLAKNDSSHKKVYYDDNMDIMALYFSTKEQLQRCRGDYEEVTNEYHEYKENAECNIKELKATKHTWEGSYKVKGDQREYKTTPVLHLPWQPIWYLATTMQPFIIVWKLSKENDTEGLSTVQEEDKGNHKSVLINVYIFNHSISNYIW